MKKKIKCYIKDTVKRIKRQVTDWEKMFGNHISEEWFVSKIYKELLKF